MAQDPTQVSNTGAALRRAPAHTQEFMPVLGMRMRMSGRPRGEEMATKQDFIHGACPKQDADSLIDYGCHTAIMRSGAVGVKVWINYQRPSAADEEPSEFPSLLNIDRDWSAESVQETMARRAQQPVKEGLFNVSSSRDPLISKLAD